ncbi:MAG: SpoIVB peptidase [Clostridiales bacterium]|nr:SpoIVB peptidase [Clostridiales bacterium]
MRKFIRIFDGAVSFVLAVIFSFVIYGSEALPDEISVKNSAETVINEIYTVSAQPELSVDSQNAESVGTAESDLKLLGVIPVKSETVTKVQDKTVLVSGQSFGIKLYTDGVIVVGTKDISVNGKSVNPSKEAGLEVGDVIVSINGEKVYSSDKVQDILNDNNGKPFNIKVNRGGEYRDFTLKPVYVENENCYKAGMWVRDSTAGIGTITFFNPSNRSVAALGHPITDVDTGEIMPILDGEAVETKVTSVSKSSSNETGSICCDFLSNSIGRLSSNTKHGIYGTYSSSLDVSGCSEYQVALPQEAQKGFCQIITTVDDTGPQVFSAEITKIYYNDDEKNMVIKITDDRLISLTGGIVQGMSGTPIIQNGKLIGAVTHVIVNNPLKGYAVFAQTMLKLSES